MPSLEHEELVELFTRDPSLAVQLAVASGRVTLPAYDALEVGPTDARDLIPSTLRVDVVVLLRRGEPVMVLLVEVQLTRDEDKPFSWPFYVTAVRARYRCPVCLLVYAVDEGIARWCGRAIELGQPGSPFTPLVVGPAQVPRVTDVQEAKAAPYRAVLSALAHGREPGSELVATTAWAGIEGFGEDERLLWLQVLLSGLNEAAKKALEKLMNLEQIKEQLPFFIEGRARGKAETMRVMIADLCDVLGVALTEERQAKLAAMDLPELEALRSALKSARAWPG